MLNVHTKGMLGNAVTLIITGVRFQSNENWPAGRCERPMSVLSCWGGRGEREAACQIGKWVAFLDANIKLASSTSTLVQAKFYNMAKGFHLKQERYV